MDKSIVNLSNGTPVNAVNATKTLTISGVVVDSETVTINNAVHPLTVDVYEFLADAALTKTAAKNIGIDINAVTTKSSGTLTLPTQPTAGDTMTIGAKVYTFIANDGVLADGKIRVGADLAGAKLAIVAAINGSDTKNVANPKVSASVFAVNVCTLTALVGGVAGDSVATTETFTAVGNVFVAATLGGGADCTAANAVTALVAAITASDTQGVGAVDGAGDTVDLTADVAGTVGNSIAISETMANGAFAGAATKMSGGLDGTVGEPDDIMIDATYLYVPVARNRVSDKNWRRVSLGSAF
jgi:hypothetical protein